MRKDELLDLLGGVDDKFYREAMGEEPLEAVPVIVSKKRGGLLRAAAAFVLGIGVTAAAGLLIYHSGIISGNGRDLPFEPNAVTEETPKTCETAREEIPFTESIGLEETPKSSEITREDIDYCLSYTMETQNLLNSTSSDKDISEITLDTLSHFLIDLNLDGTDEILVKDFHTRCPIFIFEMKDGNPVFNGSIAHDIRFNIDKYRFSDIALYEEGEEKYYYFYMTFEDISIMNAKIAAAIKYDGEEYYLDYLLSYGVIYSEARWREFPFFRRGWKTPFDDSNTFSAADYDQMEYEEFKELWEKYRALPVVSFRDISANARANITHGELVYEGVDYDYNYDEWDCLIIDGNVYSLDGETDWDTYDDISGLILDSAEAMLKLDELEYLGKFGSAEIICPYFSEDSKMYPDDSKMYRYNDEILILSRPDDRIRTASVEYKKGEYYRAVTYSVCRDRYCYSPVDWQQVPDIGGSNRYASLKFALVMYEEENYSVLYESYSQALLYTEDKGNYRYDLVAENVCTDKSADPDMMYCSDSYVVISRIDTGEIVTEIRTGQTEMPINGDFSEYSVQVFELKDGRVIYAPTRDIYGGYSPFCTFDEQGVIHLLYGDYSSLLETETGEFSQIHKLGVHFTADPDTNTLYYEDNAYTFDFTKIEAGFDVNGQMIPCFAVWHPSEQISAE